VRSAWWMIGVAVFGGVAAMLIIYAVGVAAAALDHLWRDVQEHRRAAERADAEAEAAYWVAVARANQLGITVAGYLKHAGWTTEAIKELELQTGRDVNGDGKVGGKFPDMGVNVAVQRKRVK